MKSLSQFVPRLCPCSEPFLNLGMSSEEFSNIASNLVVLIGTTLKPQCCCNPRVSHCQGFVQTVSSTLAPMPHPPPFLTPLCPVSLLSVDVTCHLVPAYIVAYLVLCFFLSLALVHGTGISYLSVCLIRL